MVVSIFRFCGDQSWGVSYQSWGGFNKVGGWFFHTIGGLKQVCAQQLTSSLETTGSLLYPYAQAQSLRSALRLSVCLSGDDDDDDDDILMMNHSFLLSGDLSTQQVDTSPTTVYGVTLLTPLERYSVPVPGI